MHSFRQVKKGDIHGYFELENMNVPFRTPEEADDGNIGIRTLVARVS